MNTVIENTFLNFNDHDELVGYDRCQRTPMSFYDECLRAAENIVADAEGRKIAVMLSGGADSEIVLRSLLAVGADVECWTYVFVEGQEPTELKMAEDLASAHNLKHCLYPIDIAAFEPEARAISTSANVPFFEATPQMKLFQHLSVSLQLYPVTGNAQVSLYKTMPDKTWHYCDSDYVIGTYRYTKNMIGVQSFFQLTPEIVLAQLLTKRYADIGSGKNKLANTVLLSTERFVKQQMYADEWPGFKIRTKLDGGEKIRPFSLKFLSGFAGDRTVLDKKHLVSYSEMVRLLQPSAA